MDIDSKSKKLLNFRPKIEFIEPDQEEESPDPVEENEQPEDVGKRRKRIKDLADAVNDLAVAAQAQIDNRAKGQVIKLDPVVDAAVISSMARSYPDADSGVITYDQYKTCRDNLRKYALNVSLKTKVTADDVAQRRAEFDSGQFNIGGFGTKEASDGRLRPELDKSSQLIEPIDMDEFGLELLKILINFLWKKFIKDKIPLPFLPDELASLNKSSRAMLKKLSAVNISVLGIKV